MAISAIVFSMTSSRSIVDRLNSRARQATPGIAEQLESAAKKLESYTRAPGSRKEADRMTSVLTPPVVQALGDELVNQLREEEGEEGLEFSLLQPERDYALASLLIASANPDLSAPALTALDTIGEMLGQLSTKQVEHLHWLTGIYGGSDEVDRMHTAAEVLLAQEPQSEAAQWANELNLELPSGAWSVHILVPGNLEEGRADIGVQVFLRNVPGGGSSWKMQIGAMSANALGGDRNPSYPDSDHGVYDRAGKITGEIVPAEGPGDIPRVLRDLERAHEALTYDRSAAKVSGSPGRLFSPKKKKRVIAWLTEEG